MGDDSKILEQLSVLKKALERLEQAEIKLRRDLMRYHLELRIKQGSVSELDEKIDLFFEKLYSPNKITFH